MEQLLNTRADRSRRSSASTNGRTIFYAAAPIMRNHLYRQGLSGRRSREEKQFWSKFLNELFSGGTKPTIRLNLILVNLGLNQEPLDEDVVTDGGQIRFVHLNEELVSLHLSGSVHTRKPGQSLCQDALVEQETSDDLLADESDIDESATLGDAEEVPRELKEHLHAILPRSKPHARISASR